MVESYVHTGSKVAVLVSLTSDSTEDLKDDAVIAMAKDICMHIAATSPVCVSRDDVPADLVAKEKDIATAQAEGKPPQAIDKIVNGKLDKYFSTSCLLEQPFVKNPDQSIGELVQSVAQESGLSLKVDQFIRFQVGEEV